MAQFMPWILDGLLVFLLLYCTYKGYRSGFARTVVSFIGYLLSVAVAAAVGNFAGHIFEKAARTPVLEFVNEKVGTAAGDDLQNAVLQFQEECPAILKNLLHYTQQGSQEISNAIDQTTLNISEAITDTMIMPALSALVHAIAFFVVFGICCFIVRKLVSMCSVLRKVPLIGSLNAVLGGILGCLEAMLVILLVASALNLIIAVTGGIGDYLTEDTVAHSHLFQFAYYLSPFSMK
ncbi:MAG: CvpA family protein [Massiliimalia sp.]|jgi:uncharacterized membrane protein required for colicin V production